MTSVYDIGIKLSLDATGVASGVSGIMSLFQRLHTQALATSGSMDAFNRSMGIMAGGMALTGVGLAGVGVMRGWTSAAGQMQEAITQVGIAAKGTQAQLAALSSQSFVVAGQTQFSAPEVLGMEQVMARMGFRDPSGKQTQRQVIGAAIPDFARAAEIDAHFMHQSAQSTVEALTQQAHMFGAYAGTALSRNVALATGAGLASGMTTSQQSNVLRYLMPAVKALNVPAIDAYALAALANQTGLTMGRGGSNLGALFRYMTPGGSLAHRQGLGEIEHLGGGSFFNQQGQFAGIPEALRVINKFMDSRAITPERRMVDLVNAFKVQGAQAAAVLGNDTSMKQFGAIRRQILPDTPAWMTGVQGQLNATLPGQWTTLQTNLQSISALLGQQLLPALAPVIHGAVELTTGVLGFLRTHEGVARFIVTFTAVSTAAALIAGPVLVAVGAFGVLAAAGIAVDVAFLPVTATILGVIAAITAVTLVIQNWDTVTAALTGRLGPLWQGVALGVSALMPITGVVGGVVLLFQKWNDITRTLAGTLSFFGATLHQIGKEYALLPHPMQTGIGAFGQAFEQSLVQQIPVIGPAIAPFIGGGGASPLHWTPSPLTAPQGAAHRQLAPVGRGPALHVHNHNHSHGPITHSHGPITVQINGAEHHDTRELARLVGQEVRESINKDMVMGSQYQATGFTGLELPAMPLG